MSLVLKFALHKSDLSFNAVGVLCCTCRRYSNTGAFYLLILKTVKAESIMFTTWRSDKKKNEII